jgi:hypothetical protein
MMLAAALYVACEAEHVFQREFLQAGAVVSSGSCYL